MALLFPTTRPGLVGIYMGMRGLQDFHWINAPQNLTWRMHEGELTLPEEGVHALCSFIRSV